jgi:hypothetical protein
VREREKERGPTRCASGETVHFYQPVAPTIHIGSTAAVVPITERNTALFPAKETYYVSKRDLLHEYKRPTSHYRAQHSIVSCNWNSTTRSDKGHIWAYKREGEGGERERERDKEREDLYGTLSARKPASFGAMRHRPPHPAKET